MKTTYVEDQLHTYKDDHLRLLSALLNSPCPTPPDVSGTPHSYAFLPFSVQSCNSAALYPQRLKRQRRERWFMEGRGGGGNSRNSWSEEGHKYHVSNFKQENFVFFFFFYIILNTRY